MQLLTDELALQLTELLLQNDKNIKDDLQAKLDAFDITVSRTTDDKGVIITIVDGDETNSVTIYDGTGTELDTAMSDTSENGVQNKVVKAYVDDAITTESITNALGYKPADQEDVSKLSKEKVSMPNDSEGAPQTGAAGQVLESAGDGTTRWADITVQDGILTEVKFSEKLKLHTIKDYVTPQMFGAIGNGINDDTKAIQNAIRFCEENHKILYIPNGIYVISDMITLSKSIVIAGTTYHYDMLSSDNAYTGLSILKCVSDDKKTFIMSEDTAYDVSISFLIFSSDSYMVETTGEIATKGNPKKYYTYTSSGYEVNCLNLEKSTRVNINNCTFNGFSGSGIITGQHRHITDCSFTHCNIGINISNYDNLIHHCWFRLCSFGIYSENHNTVFLSDSWFDQIEQMAIKNLGGGFMLISNCEFDLIEYCAIYSKYFWNSFIQARQSRCGLYYGGFEPNEVPEGEEYKACCVYSENVSRDNNFQIHIQRREIKEGYGIAPSFFFHGKGLNTSNVILDTDLDHVAKSWLFENTNLLISGKQYKARYTLKYNNTGCTTKDNDDPNGAYYSIDIGDMYISTGGKIYIAVKANSNSDWVLIGEK